MSDKGTENTGNGMVPADSDFLICCLQNLQEGSVLNVDATKVAAAKGFNNPRSVTNKIGVLKKKYNLNISSSTGKSGAAASPTAGKSKKASDEAGPNQPAIPMTPSKQRVTKPKTPAKKRTATPKAKKIKEDVEMEDASDSEKVPVASSDEEIKGEATEDEA